MEVLRCLPWIYSPCLCRDGQSTCSYEYLSGGVRNQRCEMALPYHPHRRRSDSNNDQTTYDCCAYGDAHVCLAVAIADLRPHPRLAATVTRPGASRAEWNFGKVVSVSSAGFASFGITESPCYCQQLNSFCDERRATSLLLGLPSPIASCRLAPAALPCPSWTSPRQQSRERQRARRPSHQPAQRQRSATGGTSKCVGAGTDATAAAMAAGLRHAARFVWDACADSDFWTSAHAVLRLHQVVRSHRLAPLLPVESIPLCRHIRDAPSDLQQQDEQGRKDH